MADITLNTEISGKYKIPVSGRVLVSTSANKIEWLDYDQRKQITLVNSSSGGTERTFIFEMPKGYLLIANTVDYRIIHSNKNFENFKIDRI